MVPPLQGRRGSVQNRTNGRQRAAPTGQILILSLYFTRTADITHAVDITAAGDITRETDIIASDSEAL